MQKIPEFEDAHYVELCPTAVKEDAASPIKHDRPEDLTPLTPPFLPTHPEQHQQHQRRLLYRAEALAVMFSVPPPLLLPPPPPPPLVKVEFKQGPVSRRIVYVNYVKPAAPPPPPVLKLPLMVHTFGARRRNPMSEMINAWFKTNGDAFPVSRRVVQRQPLDPTDPAITVTIAPVHPRL